MASMRLSVVVVSHGRPRPLCRCLTGIHQLSGPDIELVVVSDDDGLAALDRLPFADRIKTASQAQPNISQARNIGLSRAAGEIVAFIDDDAVPAPSWAKAIMTAFSDSPDLAAVTGPVLGRNGISLQWGHMTVDALGRDGPPAEGRFIKLHGTNMAFRRQILEDLGGFDTGFAFFLDDTDLAVRIGRAVLMTRWLDSAIVHHGFAASARRRADRVPLSLYDIGASTAVFLRKHAPADQHAIELDRLVSDQHARLLRLARRRKLGARQMHALMQGLHDGISEGQARPMSEGLIPPPSIPFQALREVEAEAPVVLSGWRHQARRLRAEAARLTGEGRIVSLFLFEPTPRKHTVSFTDGGWWEQIGGLYGPSDRSGPRLQAWGMAGRVRAEIARTRRERSHNRRL
ncbi:glycosyl transferase, family 2 [Roseibacterium elongatum DSM 19469]|uniref:Glycosyl transferase, family 2 n=1 Tax=Roseicyclus elongatus DSM 19469 TaxID=1294273 RepID=W8S3V3_9RHOB|nr:glycosyltransferase family A protein [Roseibacterium elongatum]AHM03436.1 glycosyl transferase, family 2 [Roseibacterium elongatum DSM 19469]